MSINARILSIIIFVVCLLFTSKFIFAEVQVWEGTITIPTYGWQEDVNPKFWAMEGQVKLSTTVKGTIVYPYTMQDHLYRDIEDRTYKAVFLENDYLKITCLPELGGRLHSVYDKSKGEEVFHLNNVIKPSMIAMRGAFISGGVEWNAGPQVHTVTILSPVNVFHGTNEDGSAYLEISNLEKSLRTRWTVRLTLHPGKAYLDEKITIFNPVDAMNPYYFWNCTAFPNRPGTRFIYPMTLATDHYGVDFFDWPVHKGKDLSWLKNHDTWTSIFAVDCAFDFFGAYDVDKDRGVVQVADKYKLRGKKAWTWGNWDFGLVSQKNLTDDDGPYIEVQSGPLPTQSDYGRLYPRESVSWQEWWYPVHGLGDGFEFATKDVAVQKEKKSNSLEFKIITTDKFPKAMFMAKDEQKQILGKVIDLSPLKPANVTISPSPLKTIEISIITKDGLELASFKTPLPIPQIQPPKPSRLMTVSYDELTTEEKYLKALKIDLATDRIKARKQYETILNDEQGYSQALLGIAVLEVEAGLYDKALERLKIALKRNPTNGIAWYFFGVCYLEQNDLKEALNSAARANRCFGTESIGRDLAGRAYMRLKDYDKALDAFEDAVARNPQDILANNHVLTTFFTLGDIEKTLQLANERISINPTDLIPRAIIALQDNSLNNFVRDINSIIGEKDFEMIETSLFFADMGLYANAADLLQAYVDALSTKEKSPIPLYYLAWFYQQSNQSDKAKSYLRIAARTEKDYVFASRPEAVPVFRFALEQNPKDDNAQTHIGNLLTNLGRLDEAVQHWERAVDLKTSQSIPYRNLGMYYGVVQNDLTKAQEYYKQAIEKRPEDQTLYRDLAELLIADNKPQQAIKMLESTPYRKLRRADIIIMLAQTYYDEKLYGETISLLESTPYFVNWEGQTITWDLFNRSHIERGIQRFENKKFKLALKDFEAALTYPENIGVGRSNKPREAPALYWKGMALHRLGQSKKAEAAWKSGASSPESSDEQNKFIKLCKQKLDDIY